MKKKLSILFTLSLILISTNLAFSQEAKEVDSSFEEFKALRKKEREAREAKEKEQEYKDYLEFQEFKKKKSGEIIEEQDIERKKKEGKVAYSPWAVQYSATSGIVGGTKGESGTTAQFLVVGEYHVPESKFGYRLGISSWNYTYQTHNQKFERDLISTIFLSQGNIIYPLIFQSVFLERTRISVSSADFIFDYHFNPRKLFDPYIFGGVGIGTCSNQCNALRVLTGGGIRVNIREGYFLSELLLEKPFFAFSGENHNTSISNIYSGGFRIGFGIFL